MKIADSIIHFLKSGQEKKKSIAPQGICPNCWGREEYGGHFYERLKNHGVDINSSDPDIGWINDYAEKHLRGIKLHEEEGALVCSKCKYSFKQVD